MTVPYGLSGSVGNNAKTNVSTLQNAGVPGFKDLQAEFAAAIADEQKRRQQLAGQMDTSGAQTDTYISKEAGLTPDATAAFAPGTAGYKATTAGYQPTATQAVDTGQISDVNFDALKNVDLSGVQNYKNTALNAAGDLGADQTAFAKSGAGGLGDFTAQGFDAGAAYKEYAGGAISDLMQKQKLSLKDLAGKSVAAGRLNTGFYDQDQGSVIEELTRGATSDLAEQAVNAAGITANASEQAQATTERAREAAASTTESALQGAAQVRFNAANAKDANTLQAATTAGQLGISKANDLGNLDLTQATAKTTADLNRASTIDQTTLDAAKATDATTLDALKATDASKLNAAEYQDTFKQTGAQNAAEDSQARTNQLTQAQENENNTYLNALTGGINLYTEGENAKKQSNSNFWSGILSAGGAIAGSLIPGIGTAAGAAAGGALGKGVS